MKLRSIILGFLVLTAGQQASADRIRLLADDREAIQARVDLIQQANQELLVEYFSIWNDEQSAGAFALMFDAAKRGVKVKVLMDAFSSTVPASVQAALLQKGKGPDGEQNIEIRLYNPLSLDLFNLTHRDHAKLIIADGVRMITGGRNVGDKYFGLNKKRNFSDIDVFVDGQAVIDARADFFSVWESAIVKDTDVHRYTKEGLRRMCAHVPSKEKGSCQALRTRVIHNLKMQKVRIDETLKEVLTDQPDDIVKSGTGFDWLKDIEPGAEIQYISHRPDKFVSKKSADLSKALREFAESAQQELNILSPYLIPTKNALAIFERLIQRGVKIRVVTNSLLSTDNLFAQAGYLQYKDRLIAMGIELYEYNGPDTAHGKAAVIDGHSAFVGTYNLDPRSAFINREVGILIRKTPGNRLANELTLLIEEFRQNSILVGQNGKPQNLDMQAEREKEVSQWKKALLVPMRILMPFIKSQI